MLLKIQGMGETHIIEFTGNITYKAIHFQLKDNVYTSVNNQINAENLNYDKSFLLDLEEILKNKSYDMVYCYHIKVQKDTNDVFGLGYIIGGGYEIYLMNNNGKTIEKIN